MPLPLQPRTELAHIILRCAEDEGSTLDAFHRKLGLGEKQFRRLIMGEPITLQVLRAVADYLLPGERDSLNVVLDWHECATVGRFKRIERD